MKYTYIHDMENEIEAVQLEIVRGLTLTVYMDEWDKFAQDFEDAGMYDFRWNDVSLDMGTDEWFDIQDEWKSIRKSIDKRVLPENAK